MPLSRQTASIKRVLWAAWIITFVWFRLTKVTSQTKSNFQNEILGCSCCIHCHRRCRHHHHPPRSTNRFAPNKRKSRRWQLHQHVSFSFFNFSNCLLLATIVQILLFVLCANGRFYRNSVFFLISYSNWITQSWTKWWHYTHPNWNTSSSNRCWNSSCRCSGHIRLDWPRQCKICGKLCCWRKWFPSRWYPFASSCISLNTFNSIYLKLTVKIRMLTNIWTHKINK